MQHGYIPDLVGQEDLCQLVYKGAGLIKLGAAYKNYTTFEEVLLDGRIGKSGAVRSYEQACPLEIRSLRADKSHLNGPAGELAGLDRFRHPTGRSSFALARREADRNRRKA